MQIKLRTQKSRESLQEFEADLESIINMIYSGEPKEFQQQLSNTDLHRWHSR